MAVSSANSRAAPSGISRMRRTRGMTSLAAAPVPPPPPVDTAPYRNRELDDMWRDIFLANREELLGQLRAYQQALAQFEQQIVAGDGAALEQLITQASGIRAAWHMDSFKPGT